MNILFVYKEDYPWDVRVEKVVESLMELGHDVAILSNNVKMSLSKDVVGKNRIFRLPALNNFPISLAKLAKLPLWFNPLWLFLFLSLVKNNRYDIVIVRDLPLLKLANIFKDKFGFFVIYDMAEVYPEMYRSINKFEPFSFNNFILKNPLIAERYEKSNLRKVDHTFTMIEESRDRLIEKGVNPRKLSIVSNTPALDKYQGLVMDHLGEELRIVYVGRLTRLRGLDILIEGVREFLNLGYARTDIRVDIVGTGPAKKDLVKLVESLSLTQCVKIHGWLEQKEVDSIMTAANVGVTTYRVCSHWNNTIPNKIFDYMLAGLPVVSTPITTIARIVSETECGIVISSESPYELGKVLVQLRDPSVRSRFGKNGNSAVLQRYNWDVDKANIRSAISAFEAARPRSIDE